MTKKTAIEIAFEKAEAAKRLLTDRERLDQWKQETKDPAFNESIFDWMNHRVKKGHDKVFFEGFKWLDTL